MNHEVNKRWRPSTDGVGVQVDWRRKSIQPVRQIVATRSHSCGRLGKLRAVAGPVVNHGGGGVRRPGDFAGVGGVDCCARCSCPIVARFAKKNESTAIDAVES